MATLTFDNVPDDEEVVAGAGNAMPAFARSGRGPLTFENVPDDPQYFGSSAGEFAGMQTPQTIQNPGQALASVPQRIGANLPFADRVYARTQALLGNGNYASNLEKERAYNAEMQKADPYGEAIYGQLPWMVGPAAVVKGAVGTAEKAIPLGQQVWRGIVGGSGLGLTQGASNVKDFTNPSYQDVTNAAISTGVGGALGGTIPALAKGVGGVYNWAANKLNGRIPGMMPEVQAALTDAVMSSNPDRSMPAFQKLGPQGMMAEYNPATMEAAQGMRLRGNEPRNIIEEPFQARDQAAEGVVHDAFNKSFGPPVDAETEIAALRDQRAQINKAGGPQQIVEDARDQGIKVDTTNLLTNLGNKLVKSQGNPKMQGVLKEVRGLVTEPVLDPQGDPIIGVDGEPLRNPINDPMVLHNAKEYLGKVFEKGDDGLHIAPGELSKSEGAAANLYKEMNQALRNQVPNYAAVNDQLSSLHRQEENIQAGQDILGGKTSVTPASHGATYNVLPPEEQNARRIGMRSSMGSILGTNAVGDDVLPAQRIFQGEGGYNKEKIGQVFGQQPTQEAFDVTQAQAQMRNNKRGLIDNSKTADRLIAERHLGEAAAPPQNIVPDLRNLTAVGTVAGPAAWAANRGINAFRPVMNVPQFNRQMATGLVTPGQDAVALIDALRGKAANQARNAAMAEGWRQSIARALAGSASQGVGTVQNQFGWPNQ